MNQHFQQGSPQPCASCKMKIRSYFSMGFLAITFLVLAGYSGVSGFLSGTNVATKVLSRKVQQTTSTLGTFSTYSRGAEIWPECNEDLVQLSDSFPGGKIPYSAIMALDQQDMALMRTPVDQVTETSGEVESPEMKMKRRRVARFSMNQTVRRILRRAAAREELDNEQSVERGTPRGWDKTPVVIALALLLKGLIRPIDVLCVASLTTYFIILNMVARSPREGGLTPIMPSMPPQGHVPTLVSNPLGVGTLYSSSYDRWLKIGIVLGLLVPLGQAGYAFAKLDDIAAARVFARPVFLLCCQAVSEAVSRKALSPLPLRILIPVAYNTVRLAYLWDCAVTPLGLGKIGRIFAVGNAAYWAINLFAFLIPVALVRYMRAYFFGVEASEVTTRIGMEDSMGLIPNKQ